MYICDVGDGGHGVKGETSIISVSHECGLALTRGTAFIHLLY